MGLDEVLRAAAAAPRQQRVGARRFTVPRPTRGLFRDRPALEVPAEGLVDAFNVRIQDGQVTSKNMGWTAFEMGGVPLYPNLSAPTTGVVLRNHVTMIARFLTRLGADVLVLGTKRDIFEYDPVGELAVYITQRYDTGTAAVTVGTTAVTGVDTAWNTTPVGDPRPNVRAGDFIHFGDAAYTVNDTSWYEIAASAITPTGLSLVTISEDEHAAGVYTIRRCFNAGEEDVWDYQVFTDAQPGDVDLMFFTNGSEMAKWDQANDELELIDLGFVARVLDVQKDIMLYGHLTDSGGEVKPQSFRSAAPSTPEVVAGDGSMELAIGSGADPLISLDRLGPYTVAYFDNQLSILEFVGGPLKWVIRTVNARHGLVSRRSIVNRGDFHEFLSRDRAYRFNGAAIEPLGPQVFEPVMRREFDHTRQTAAIGWLDNEQGEVQWVLPITTDDDAAEVWGAPENAYTEHYQEARARAEVPMTYRELPATAVGEWNRGGANPIQFDSPELSGLGYDDITFAWNDRFFGKDFPLVLFGDKSGLVWQLNVGNLQGATNIVSRAKFARFALIDGDAKGLLTRVTPYLTRSGPAGQTVNVVVWYSELANSVSKKRVTLPITNDAGSTADRFVSPREAMRFAEIEIEALASQVWTLGGYGVQALPMGDR